MVEIVTSSGLGLQESSASVLGSRGRVGSGRLGQDELRVAVNAVNGNLVIQGQDEVLLGVGLDESVFNTYNSQGTFTANGWQESYQRHVGGLTGTVNTTGSTITHYASDGSAIVYTYNGTKGVYVGNELGGANDTLSFNSTTNRWSWTDGQSRSIEVYDNANGGRLLSSSDADGNLLSYSYTGSQLTRITTANGEYTDFSYTGSLLTALVTSYTNASGLHSLTRVRYGYDGSNRLTTVSVDLSPQDNVVTDGKVYVTSYGYDGTSNRISSITQKDSDGVTLVRVDVAYVQVGSAYAVSTVTQATLNNTTTSTTSLSYNVANRRTTITDALGNQSVMVYDTSGRLTQLISPPLVSGGAQQAESFVYNSNGNLLYSGPTGDPNFTNIGLNWNDLYQSSNTVSTTQSTEVDGGVNVYRRQSTTTPPSGWVMRLGQSQQAWAAVSAGQTVNLKAYVSSTGASQIRLYAIFRDVNGAAISSLALNFPSVGGVFGANGVASANLASGSAAVPAGAAYVELVFQAIADGTGPLNVAIAQPSVAVGGAPVAGSIPPAYNYAYDGNGNRISMTDALGNQTLYTYDPNNNQLLTATEYADASTPMTTRYVYDGESHLVYTISPLGAVTKYIYNAAGQQTSVIEYTAAAHFYDVSSLSTSTSPALQTMNNWSSALTDLSTAKRTDMVYDARGALSSVTTYAKTTSAGDGDTSTASTTTYVYDQAGLLLSKVLPGSSATEVYLYDGLGRTLSFTDFNGKITQSLYSSGNGYDDNGSYFEGAKVVTTMANGTIQTSLYDLAGDLKKVTVSGLGGLISSTTYTYDRLSRLVKTTDATGLSNYFVYDAQGHKVADVDADGSLTVYRYNANDQIISTTSYATRLSAAQITSLGSVTESTTTALSLSGLIPTASASDRWGWNVYDFDGRLVETIDATGAVTAYIYDKASHLLSTTSYATLLSAATVTGFKTMAPASAVLPTADATNDRVVRNLYNIDGQLVGVLDADGYLTQTVYDEAGQSVKTIRYATQAASNLWATGTFADLKTSVGTSTSDIHNWSVYDNAGLLRAVVDGEGNVTRYDNYTGAGSVGKVTRGLWANPATLIATPPTFATLETSGTAPEITTYTYDQYGHVLTQSLALSDGVTETTTYSYDSSYNLIKQSTASISSATGAADGRTSTVRYDSLGRKVAQLSGVGSAALANLGANPTQAQIDGVWAQYQESYAYDAAGRLISQTDPNGNRTLFYYNSDGQLAYQIDATGAVVGYSYNAFGEKTDVTAYATKLSTTVLAGLVGGQVVTALTSAIQTSAQDSHSHVDFNIDGTVADTIDALGVTTNYAYNAFGEMTGRTDPVTAGVVRTTSKTYSRRGLLMSSTADVGGLALTTSYQYDAFGRTTQVTDPAASVRKTTYDRAGHVLTQVDALNQSTVFTYDSLGHVLTVTDRTGAITRYFYTKLFDRQVTVSDDAGSTIKTVNAYGETVKVVDGVGTITTYSYDADGHVLTQVVDNKSGGLNLTTQYTYDNVGNLISMTDPVGAVTRYIYDGDNRQTYVIAPTGAVTGYIYDALGQVVQSTRYGLRYTATGVQSKSTLDTWTSTTALPYASSDRITRAAYDVAGRLAYELDELGGVTAYVYDAEGRVLQSIQYAVRDASLITATTIQSKADMDIWASGHVNVADIKTRSVYDAGGRLSYAIDGTGAVTRYVYDGDGRVLQSTQYAVRDASLNTTTTIQSKTDMDSWASSHADAINDRVTRSVYDAEGRQVYSIDAMGVVTSYVYDAEGRVLKSTSYAVAYGNAAYELAKAAYQVALGRLPDYAGWMNWGGALDSGSITQPDFVQSVVSSAEFINKTSKLVNNVSVRMTNSEIVEYLYNAAFGRTSSGDATAAGYVTQLNNGTLTVANLVLTLAQSSESQAREAKLLGTKYAALLPIAPAGSLRVTQAVYDAVGRLSYSIDAMGAVTRYVYDAEGRVLQKIDYAVLKGPTTTIQSKTDMDTWAVTAANAVNDRVTRSVYDAAGRLSYSIDALGAVTKYTYDGAGKVTSSLQYGVLRTVPNTLVDIPSKTTMDQWVAANANAANDHQTVTAYDIGTRTTTITTTVDETRSTVTKVVYNIFGEKQDVTVAFGTNDAVTTHWGYYRTGWIASQATAYGTDDAAVVSFTYDAFGNKKTVTEGNGNATTDVVNDYVTTYSYDKEGRVLTKTEPTGALTVNTYNAFGDLVKVTDPNNNSGYFYYDVLGRKTWQVDPQGYVTKTTYDNSGNILSTTRYATALNNASDVPSTVTIKADKDNKTTFTRDGEGRVLTSTDGENNITSYVYNAFGDRISMTNATGHTVTYSYDVRGLMLSQVTPKTEVDGVQIAPATTTAYVYDGFGNRTQMIEAQGLTEQRTTTYVYDKNNQLTSQIGDAVDVTGSTSTVMPTQSFTYDLRGNQTSATDANGAKTVTYYDRQDRVTAQVNALGGLSTWSYDKNGNLLSQRVYGTALSLPVSTGTVPTPVNASNVRETKYTYDQANRRLTTSLVGAVSGKWVSDANPWVSSTNDLKSETAYDNNGNVIRETDANGNSTYYYYDKLGRKTAQIDPSGYLTTYTLDAEGNVTLQVQYATALSGTFTGGGNPAYGTKYSARH